MQHEAGLSWPEVFALVSIIFTIVGAFWGFSRIIKTDIKESVVDLHLVPMNERLGKINGRVSKVETTVVKVDQSFSDHIKADERSFEQVHGRIGSVESDFDKDVRELRKRIDGLSISQSTSQGGNG